MPRKRGNKKAAKPKKIDVSAKEWEEQTKEEKAHTVKTLVNKFTELGLKDVSIVVARETQYPQGFSAEHLAAVGSCTEAQGEKLSSYSNLLDTFGKFEVEMASCVVGAKLPFLVSAFDLDKKETPILEDRRGKPIIINFWYPELAQSVDGVMEVIKKRASDWKDKAHFLTIACESGLDEVKAVLAEKKWDSPLVKHLWAGEPQDEEVEEDGDSVVAKYEIQELPEVMVVDAEGNLLKRGNPEDIQFEATVDKVIAGETNLETLPANTPGMWQNHSEEKRKTLLDKGLAVLAEEDNLSDLLIVTADAEIHSIMSGTCRHEKDVMIVGKVDVRAEDKVHLITDIFVKEGGVTDVEKTVVITAPVREVEPQNNCSNCNKAFASMDQSSLVRWHCAMCVDGYTICNDCEQVKDKKHADYHPLFRMGPVVSNKDLLEAEFKVGSFATCMLDAEQAAGGCCADDTCHDSSCGDEGMNMIHEDVFCNGCRDGPISGGPRWKCCSCADYDLCTACYNSFLADAEGVQVKGPKSEKDVEHLSNHFFVRIEDSQLVQIAGDDVEGEGDDQFPDGIGEDDIELLTRAMAQGDDLAAFGDDPESILQKIRELRASGDLDEEEWQDADVIEDEAAKLTNLAEEAAQVALPDDDDDF